ncbi:Small RNA 2'-O-methyltransferase-like [Melia azedarach]|uniref:Small RNA 2'-O-methyltransferase-like n=1 Tax=Melia azedarach TaxID=155640 RepID=A0ACC1WV56_MELAZ|nr:Small RNA 2'-O-methyltransferase-like [Melia azedarach]
METGGLSAVAVKKASLTPKAIIFQKFGKAAQYTIDEVQDVAQNGCPGLAIPQKGPCLYRCNLQLPEFSVVSETFKKKKDAEQSAAEKALDKLGIHASPNNPSAEEAWDKLIASVKYLFSDEFISSPHPLSGHFRAALQRDGDLYGSVPASVIVAYDSKLSNLCKLINTKESNSQNPQILYALKPYLSQVHWKRPFSHCTLNVSSTGYYLDVIARKLGLTDGNNVLVSRTIGKASSEMRLYFAAPMSYVLDLSSDLLDFKEVVHFEGSLNPRASYFFGQDVYGDAVLASIGYTWKSKDLFHEDVTLQSYYRMLINLMPSGVYKLSREAILTAELPEAFTTRTNWRGSFPREVLWSAEREKACTSGDQERVRCEVKIFSKSQDLILECSPKELYKKQSDAIQSACLKVLSWLNAYFKDPEMPLKKLNDFSGSLNIQFYPKNFFKKFALYRSIRSVQHSKTEGDKLLKPNSIDMLNGTPEHGIHCLSIEGPDSGVCPSNGCLSFICYSVSLVIEGEQMKELLESKEEFEFEIGAGAVIPHVEAVTTQMSVGQSACFTKELPPRDFILAVADDSARTLSLLSSKTCCLEYYITLLQVTEPPEDRMEQAFFSPPLSKQRVEYAVQHIRESCATTLVDFGCGSGSLLDSLLDYPTSLEKIVGVDISQKSLSRAAKVLHSKLSKKLDAVVPCTKVKSAVLYDGSITVSDSRLRSFDIGTCLEVIEHMEEDEASLFGSIVLSYFRPRILIVSTPNYEYNVILQKSSLTSQEDDPDEKTQLQSCKFRNHDHKFEWTRDQFNCWATELATRHNYSVEFSGVGGSANIEPGFASQIAVFRSRSTPEEDKDNPSEDGDSTHYYKVIWEWDSSNWSRSAL